MTLQELKELAENAKINNTRDEWQPLPVHIRFHDQKLIMATSPEVVLQLIERCEELSETLRNQQCVYSTKSLNGYIIEQTHLDNQCKKCIALDLYGSEVPFT